MQISSPVDSTKVVSLTGVETLTNKTITDDTNDVSAKSLKSATTTIDVSSATAPTNGQVLQATSGTAAQWGNVSGVTPTGTGFVHVTTGTQDMASKTVEDADVAANAAIAQSKLDLSITNTEVAANAAIAASKLDGVSTPSSTDSLTNKTITDDTNTVTADGLRSATTTVDVSAATAPSNGQVLTATGSTAATWQTPSAGGGNTSNLLSGLTPTFAGFDTNPGTNTDIISELGLASITTNGSTAGSGIVSIKYDLGSSKRVIVYGKVQGLNISDLQIDISDNDTDYFHCGENYTAGVNIQACGVGKCRYVKYIMFATDALTLGPIYLRVYAI